MKHKALSVAVTAGIAVLMSANTVFAAWADARVSSNIRSGPGIGYPVVDTLYPGERVDVRRCTDSGWCYVVHPGPDGWVSQRLLNWRDYYYRERPSSDALVLLPFLFALPFILNDHDHHRPPRRR